MKQSIVEHISTLNYIDSWAKQVKRQTEDIKKLFSSTFGNHHQEYPYELLEIKDAINGIIDNILPLGILKKREITAIQKMMK